MTAIDEVRADLRTALSTDERAQFERDGYVIVPAALDADEVDRARNAVQDAYTRARRDKRLDANGSLHQLSAVAAAPELAFLTDHPATLRYVWTLLGWNVHIHHSHVDVHPPVAKASPDWWHWHQDGGRQNRELETTPRPRMSVKVAFWLSDVSQPGRGNFTIVPASHRRDWLPGPPQRSVAWPAPRNAMPVRVRAGDAVVFDRRLWHARSDNLSEVTRMAAFFGYTYRWVRMRDENEALPQEPWWSALSPVQQQLLGRCAGSGDNCSRTAIRPDSGDHAWGHDPSTVPLYLQLSQRGLLDHANPPLQP